MEGGEGVVGREGRVWWGGWEGCGGEGGGGREGGVRSVFLLLPLLHCCRGTVVNPSFVRRHKSLHKAGGVSSISAPIVSRHAEPDAV